MFIAKRIDSEEYVQGNYFVSPLTDENSGTPPEAGHHFLSGETRHCIQRNDGTVCVIDLKTLMFMGMDVAK